MQEGAADDAGVADEQVEGGDRPVAVAEHGGGSERERGEKCCGVVGLLRYGGGLPPAGAGAAGVAAPVVGDHGELVGEQVRDSVEVSGIAGRAGDEQHRRAGAPKLVVDLCPVHGNRRHSDFLS